MLVPAKAGISARLDHGRHPIRLGEGAIPNTDFAANNGNAVQRFASALIRQFEIIETFRRQAKSAVDTPQFVRGLGRRSRLGYRCTVNDTDQTAAI